MIDVPDIQLDALVPLDFLAAVHLCPAGQTRADVKHPELFLGVFLDRPGMVGQRRSGANQRHLPLQDVDELREFIDTGRADHTTDFCDAGVALAGVDAGAGVLRVHAHGAEFDDLEDLCAAPDALLFKQHRAGGFELDQHRDDQHRDRADDQYQKRYDDIDNSFNDSIIHSDPLFGSVLHDKTQLLIVSHFILYMILQNVYVVKQFAHFLLTVFFAKNDIFCEK